MNGTAAYVSTFQAKKGSERLLQSELQRLVAFTRREQSCLFCDLFRVSNDKTSFVVHSVWSSHEVWLGRAGWEKHPAGIGLLDQCLQRPVEVVALDEVA
jgi:quinol monooxygenase YgiN